MSKNVQFILTLLLLCTVFLSSCSVVGVIDHGTTEAKEEETTPEKKEPYSVYGVWYSKESRIVLEISDNNQTVKIYSITPGYYEYSAAETGTYTLSGSKLTLIFGGETYDLEFDENKGTITLGEFVYEPQKALPVKHPVYDFPNYADMDFSGMISIGELKLADLKKTALEGARIEIFAQYYNSGLETPAKITDRPAQEGDYVNIDYTGKTLDGVAFSGGSASDADAFISDYTNDFVKGFIPGFVDGIVGKTVGSTFDVAVTFPENYHSADLAGKDVIFTMTLNAIYDLKLTNEQFGTFENLEYKTYDEWVNGLAKILASDLSENTLQDACEMTGAMNKEHYQYFYQYTLDYWHRMAEAYGMEYKTMLAAIGLTEEAMLLEAQSTALYYMTNYHVAKQENLTWTEEEYSKEYEKYVNSYLESYKDAPREDAEAYANSQLPVIKTNLTIQIVSKWIVEQAFA